MSSLKENASVMGLAALLALAFVPVPFAIAPSILAASAQPTTPNLPFPLPETAPNGLTVRIDGDSSMVFINQALAQRFENQFPETEIVSNYSGTEAALQALLVDQIDLAVISRLLTDTEKALGLVDFPFTRHRIAMIVGADNPFEGDLTIRQFAQIFRGELTNWAEVGGPSRPIRKIDRPHRSDTRKAFQNYLIFQEAAFETGRNAITLSEDSTDAVIKQLGSDGISYAIADQVLDNPNVRIVPMHNVLPEDDRYPFSQPLSYVYKGPTPNPAAQAFLGYAAAPANERAIESARIKGALAEIAGELSLSSAVNSVDASGTAATGGDQAAALSEPGDSAEETVAQAPGAANGGVAAEAGSQFSAVGWLVILLLLGVPLILWLITQRRSSTVPATSLQKSRLILVPRNAQAAFAYWEAAKADQQALRQQGGRRYMLRLYDVTDIDPKRQAPRRLHQFECSEQAACKHVSIEGAGREYIAELGYVTSQGKWLNLASSDKVSMPIDPSETKREKGEAGIAENPRLFKQPVDVALSLSPLAEPSKSVAPSSLADSPKPQTEAPMDSPSSEASVTQLEPQSSETSRIILTPRTSQSAYAYWEVSEAAKEKQRQSSTQHWTLRIHDVTDINVDHQTPHSTQEYACDQLSQDMHVAIPLADRDYLADLGYVTDENQWRSIVRSLHIRAPFGG